MSSPGGPPGGPSRRPVSSRYGGRPGGPPAGGGTPGGGPPRPGAGPPGDRPRPTPPPQRHAEPNPPSQATYDKEMDKDKSGKKSLCSLERILNVLWFFCFVFFCLWNFYIFQENKDSIFNPVPGTGVAYEEPPAEGLNFPAVSICNMGVGVPLSLYKCQTPQGADCVQQARNFTSPTGRACFKFNVCDSKEKCHAYTTAVGDKGEDGDRSLFKVVMSIHTDKYLPSMETAGVTVTLHDNAEQPKLQSKGFFAPPGLGVLVRMRKIVERFLDGHEEHNYEATSSLAGLKNLEPYGNRPDDIVHLTFTYRQLSIMVINQNPPYTILTFFSEMGGLAGLLLGMGLFQVIEAFSACCQKRCCGGSRKEP